jgi:hypothetical protein
VEDNGAAHPAEFEEWELNAFSDSIANSWSPAGVTVGS